jgi:hypothetical protein
MHGETMKQVTLYLGKCRPDAEFLILFRYYFVLRGQAVVQIVEALRYKPGSIPDGTIGIFHGHNPSGCTNALGFTKPLTRMSTRNISWSVKVAGA